MDPERRCDEGGPESAVGTQERECHGGDTRGHPVRTSAARSHRGVAEGADPGHGHGGALGEVLSAGCDMYRS